MILACETHCSQSRTLGSSDSLLMSCRVRCRADPLFHLPIVSWPGTLANIFIKPMPEYPSLWNIGNQTRDILAILAIRGKPFLQSPVNYNDMNLEENSKLNVTISFRTKKWSVDDHPSRSKGQKYQEGRTQEQKGAYEEGGAWVIRLFHFQSKQSLKIDVTFWFLNVFFPA